MENTCNRIRKAPEPVSTGDEGILDSSVLEIRKHTGTEVGALACKGQYIIDGSCHWTVFLIHCLVINLIKPYDGIRLVQRPGLFFQLCIS